MPYLLGMCAEFDEGGQAAAFGGFASKMGLASGPLLGALLLKEENYSLLISISGVGILLCMVAAFIPARMLDIGQKVVGANAAGPPGAASSLPNS